MTRPTTIFYVYAETDETLRQQLEKHLALLQRQGVLASWQESLAGALWEQEREQTLGEASLILLLVSADFLASDVCYKEQMQRALERQKRGEVQVLPVLVRPVDVTNAPFTHLPMVPTNGQAVMVWSNQDAAWTHITEGIRCVLEGKPLPVVQEQKEAATYSMENQVAQGPVMGEHNTVYQHFYAPASPPPIPIASPVKPIWMVPYARNPFFTGREEVLAELHVRFQQGQVQAVSQPQAMSGLGGIGKTQIAVEYAYQHAEDYPVVLWVRADTQENLVSGYVAIAQELKLEEKDERERDGIVQAVKRWLMSTQSRWLLLLDNADDLKLVGAFLPSKYAGHILLTTRAQATGRLAQRLEVQVLDRKRGAVLLLRRASLIPADGGVDHASSVDGVLAREIAEKLGGLPLALDQAGAYIEETQCSLQEYLKFYRARSAELLQERGDLIEDHPESVATTWSLSFQKVEQRNPAAADLLRVCAFLAPDAIPEELFTQGVMQLGPILCREAEDAFWLPKAIRVLGVYSLVQRETKEQMLSVHRLVQVVLKDEMEGATRKAWRERVIRAVVVSLPNVEHENWWQWERMLVQAQMCAEYIKQGDGAMPEGARLLHQTGVYLLDRGWHHHARPLFHLAMHFREQYLGQEHLETANTMAYVALLYEVQSHYPEAELLYKRVLEIREQELGLTHPDTVQSVNDLARFYRTRSKYVEAEPLYKRVLEVKEQELGPMHLDTAQSVDNLAMLYWMESKYVEAEPLCKRVLEIKEQKLGPTHPDTVQSVNDLAWLYWMESKYVEAEPLYKRALEVKEQELGPMHLDTVTSLDSLAKLYRVQGKYAEAEELYLRALAIREQKLWPRHQDMAQSVNNLVEFYKEQGRYAEAELLLAQALEISEQELGPRHPDMVRILNDMAMLYQKQGRYAEVEPLLVQAWEISEQSLEPGDPDTSRSMNDLVEFYKEQGRYAEAEPLLVRAWEISEQLLGATHPSTTLCISNLAQLYSVQGKYDEAEPLYKQVLAIYEQELGSTHFATAMSLNNLAVLYQAQRKYVEAEPLYKQVLAIYEQTLGPMHFATAMSLSSLAQLYSVQGKYAEAEPLYRRALESLGGGHLMIEQVRREYAGLLRVLGREEEAAALEVKGE